MCVGTVFCMKKYLILLVITMIAGNAMSAGYRYSRHDNYHFGYVYGGGGFSSLTENVPEVSITGNWAGMMGLGYEFRNSGFWMNAGVQFQQLNSTAQVKAFSVGPLAGIDRMGMPADFYYEASQKDVQRWATIGIPVMAGYYVHGFYIGAGLKLAYNLNSRSDVLGTYETSAQYARYPERWRDMPALGYTTYDVKSNKAVTLRPHGAVIGELGYDLLSSLPTKSAVCHVLKLGVYFEVGITNLFETHEAPVNFIVDANDAMQATMVPYLESCMVKEQFVRPFFTGIKLTYMIGGSRFGGGNIYHRGCQCYD